MKILIAGIDGYIGTVMGQVLQERGHDVAGLDTGFYREGWLYNGVTKLPPIIVKDTRNVTVDDLNGYDAVIHLADLSNDPISNRNEKNTYAINHGGTVHLATLAKQAGVKRFLYSSSCSVYGIAKEDLTTEESEVNPQTAYAKCKVLAEQDIQKLADDNFSPTFLRNATVYGPSPRMRFDLVVNNLCGHAWVNHEIRMTSDGTPWRPLVHILDVCEAFACVLGAPKDSIHNEVFNVGNSTSNYRIKDIAEIIKTVFAGCTVTFGKLDGDTRSYRVSFEKIQDKLPGFTSKRTVEDGAKELKQLFERIKLSRELFEFRAFTRLTELDYLVKTNQLDEQFFWRKYE
ncbi:SDR family oxidoreductase [Candidatus Roizmanbacteria bacterium]|nr:SDR family oxidoreductase [Candidatus Roizmanbacteria bacterium]